MYFMQNNLVHFYMNLISKSVPSDQSNLKKIGGNLDEILKVADYKFDID